MLQHTSLSHSTKPAALAGAQAACSHVYTLSESSFMFRIRQNAIRTANRSMKRRYQWVEAALLHTSGSQQSGHIKSRHALNGGPQNKRNALFRSSYVALVMPDTAREREREIEQGERCMAKGHERRKNRKRRLSQAGCTSPTPIHSVRVLLPRLLASPLPTHPLLLWSARISSVHFPSVASDGDFTAHTTAWISNTDA